MEIKFRGKRLDNGEWVYGDIIQLHDGRRFIVNNKHGACIDNKGNFINTEAPFVCEVEPATVGQYTGLKDKNGVEIYEGDIFKALHDKRSLCVVKLGNYFPKAVNEYFEFIGHKPRMITGFYAEAFKIKELMMIGPDMAVEVIGNIHDNANLPEEPIC